MQDTENITKLENIDEKMASFFNNTEQQWLEQKQKLEATRPLPRYCFHWFHEMLSVSSLHKH